MAKTSAKKAVPDGETLKTSVKKTIKAPNESAKKAENEPKTSADGYEKPQNVQKNVHLKADDGVKDVNGTENVQKNVHPDGQTAEKSSQNADGANKSAADPAGNGANARQLTVKDLTDKRKLRWSEGKGIEWDAKYREWCAEKVLTDEKMHAEIEKKPYLLIELCFVIVDKRKDTVPFFLNEVQTEFIRLYEEYGTARPYFILKGRQQGFTSLITAMQLSFAIVRKNFAGFTLADTTDNTGAIFQDKAKVTYDRLPDILHPGEKYNNQRELFFDKLNSSWRVSTATNDVGRSRTLSFIHFSEAAFFQCSLASLQKSIGEAAIADATRIYETTANGFNEAKELWDSGSCNNLFFEWWKTSEYRSTDESFLEGMDGWLTERVRWLEHKGLDRAQIAWYARKYAGYIDKSTIKQEYPCTPEEAFVSSGLSIFDMDKLADAMTRIEKTKGRRGVFEYDKISSPIYDAFGKIAGYEWELKNIRFAESAAGYICLHSEPRISKDQYGNVNGLCPYAIGGDTAGSGIDYFTAKVIDNTNGHTVATLRVQRIDEDIYAEQMYCLGKYYNDALIGIETNYSRQPTRHLQMVLRYPNLYLRQKMNGYGDVAEQVAGFETTAITKPIILSNLVQIFRADPSIECDMDTLKEMTVFVKHDNGKQGAINGAHDDLVMALAIAHQVGGQQKHDFVQQQIFTAVDKWIKETVKEDETGEEFVNW